MNQNKQNKKTNIQAGKDELRGNYSNVMRVVHNKEEFVLDFMNIVEGNGVLSSRIFVSPGHLKRMVKVLQDNLKNYEDQFGNIEPGENPKPQIGFKP